MQYDAERLMQNLGAQWSGQLAQANQQIAIMAEENRLLKEELEFYKNKEKEEEEEATEGE